MKHTMTGTVALAAVLAAATAGCTPEPESGTVVEMEHEKAYSMTTQDCQTRYTTRNGRTTSTTTCTPRTVYYPECWEVEYENEAEEATGEDCVSEELFNALEVGDEYRKGMSPSDVA